MRSIVSIAVVIGAAVSLGAGPAGADPLKDSVKGNGINNPLNGNFNRFHVNVQSGPNGEDVKGLVTFTSPESKRSFTGEATCLRVSGKRATIVADFTRSRRQGDGFENANGVVVEIEDVGSKVAGKAPDEIGNTITPVQELPATCPAPADPGKLPLRKGDIRVEDN